MQSINSVAGKSVSSKLLLAIAGLVPFVVFTPASQAQTLQSENVANTQAKQVESSSPFIDASARYNTLERMKNAPTVPGGFDDFSTGKEATDKDKESSDKGKDMCEKGKDACDSSLPPGTIIAPGELEPIRRGPETVNPRPVPVERPNELLRGPGVIF